MLGVALLVQVIIFRVWWKRWVNRTYYSSSERGSRGIAQQRRPQRPRRHRRSRSCRGVASFGSFSPDGTTPPSPRIDRTKAATCSPPAYPQGARVGPGSPRRWGGGASRCKYSPPWGERAVRLAVQGDSAAAASEPLAPSSHPERLQPAVPPSSQPAAHIRGESCAARARHAAADRASRSRSSRDSEPSGHGVIPPHRGNDREVQGQLGA